MERLTSAAQLRARLKPYFVAFTVVTLAPPAIAQLTATDFQSLNQQGLQAGWTFTIGPNPATQIPIQQLCGLVAPAQPDLSAPLQAPPPTLRTLPAAYDWRAETGCPPVRNQGACGSCWAFGTVGALECAIKVRDDDVVDLSEQYLVSCNDEGYSCNGGWWVFPYFMTATDPCGGAGAVLEAAFPYTAHDSACACPYAHSYTIDAWGYVATSSSVPSVEAIKSAILTYGPVSVAVCVNDAFHAYTGGIFNASTLAAVNHGVVLVGWDDNGGNGYWILRNSWGAGWGEAGYMRIAYGCSNVGYGAAYVDYPGTSAATIEVTPASLDFGTVEVGVPAIRVVTVKNVGIDPLSGSASALAAPFSFTASPDYNLASGATKALTIVCDPSLRGNYTASVAFSGGGGDTISIVAATTGDGAPADQCAAAPAVGDGVFTADISDADTDRTGSCGGGGARDVWYRFVAPLAGRATFDTAGSDFDTVLSIYESCDGDELACNDDADGVATSTASLSVVAGGSCYVRVAGVAGQSGTAQLTISTEAVQLHVSGRITDARGEGIGGVSLAGLPGTPLTDLDGRYSATVDYGFSGDIIPSKAGWEIQPAQWEYATLTADDNAAYFVGVPLTFVVSGRIIDENGRGLPSVSLTGFETTVRTDSAGYYAANVTYGFSASVAPQLPGYVFTPPRRDYANVTAVRHDDDFVAELQLGSLIVVLAPAHVPAAAWRVDGSAWRAGGEIAVGLNVGMHVVEYADIAGYDTPPREAANVRADQVTTLTRTYAASVAECTLEVAVDPSGAGTVLTESSTGLLECGAVVGLFAQPADGYALVAWHGVDAADEAGAALTLSGAHTVVAEFVATAEVDPSDNEIQPGPSIPVAVPCGAGSVLWMPLCVIGWGAMRWSPVGRPRPPT